MTQSEEFIKTVTSAVDLAVRFFHQGDLNKARALHLENLTKDLTDEDRLRTLLGLVAVEWTAGDLNLAYSYMTEAKTLAQKSSPSFGTLAMLHNNYGLLLRRLADNAENKTEYIDKAIIEYTAASFYYEQDANIKLHGAVENNLAFLHLSCHRYEQALTHAEKSKGLVESIGDLTQLADILDTTAQIYLAMNNLPEAYKSITKAIELLPEGTEHISWFDVSSTHARILFRLENFTEGKQVLEEAISQAEAMGKLNVVGKLTLLIMENCEHLLMPLDIVTLYQKVYPLLTDEKDINRLAATINKFFSILNPQRRETINLDETFDNLERETVQRALHRTNGSITRAADLCGYSHQRLQSKLEKNLIDLSKERTPPRRRRKGMMNRK